MTSPGAAHAVMFQRHMHLYGTTSRQLAAISVAFRKHALLNPEAVMQKPITIEDHQSSRFIAEPLRLFDYCLINDGSVALIVTTAERARDFPKAPVYIRGFGTADQAGQFVAAAGRFLVCADAERGAADLPDGRRDA